MSWSNVLAQKLVVLLALTTATGAVSFAAAPEPDRFTALLEAIDVVPPDRAALEAAVPDAWTRLTAAARDGARTTWTRVRAVSLLSYFAEPRTRAALEALSGDGDAAIRRQAIYTLGRAFGAVADLALVRFIEARVADRDPEVGEHALRSLRWIDHPAAEAALERFTREGAASMRALARTTRAKRASRLAVP